MLISRAPLRISLLGGGSDYKEYFSMNDACGSVLGLAINKYVYVNFLLQPSYEDVKFKFTYRLTESVDDIKKIVHPALRESLKKYNWDLPLNISTMANIPGRSGLGSSSSFTVALIAGLNKIKFKEINFHEIAKEAVEIEREILREAGGMQDQFFASYGGFRNFRFTKNEIVVSEDISTYSNVKDLANNFVLVAFGKTRDSAKFAAETAQSVSRVKNSKLLEELVQLTDNTFNELRNGQKSEKLVKILSDAMIEGWKMKLSLSPISNTAAEDLIQFGLKKGALAGKLCGAGGSGFALFVVNPENKTRFINNFDPINIIKDIGVSDGVKVDEF